MEEARSRYSGFDILSQYKEWDPHTREIVLKRTGPFPELKFLTPAEGEQLACIAGHLVYDNRPRILDYIISYIDQKLASAIGESQRKPEVPPESILIRDGLIALNKLALDKHQREFIQLQNSQQYAIIAMLQNGSAPALPDWKKIPQKDLFQKLISLTVSAYYSHPTVWSEIGYGGPAYPRGYLRVELGLTDPWEARLNE